MDVHPIKNVSIGIDPYPYVQELAVTGNDLPPPRLETACQTLQGGHFFHVQQALKLARRARPWTFSKDPFARKQSDVLLLISQLLDILKKDVGYYITIWLFNIAMENPL